MQALKLDKNTYTPSVRHMLSLEKKVGFPLVLSATSQQYFSLTTNQPPATSQQYFSF
jgi:hypothetical protein